MSNSTTIVVALLLLIVPDAISAKPETYEKSEFGTGSPLDKICELLKSLSDDQVLTLANCQMGTLVQDLVDYKNKTIDCMIDAYGDSATGRLEWYYDQRTNVCTLKTPPKYLQFQKCVVSYLQAHPDVAKRLQERPTGQEIANLKVCMRGNLGRFTPQLIELIINTLYPSPLAPKGEAGDANDGSKEDLEEEVHTPGY